MPIPLVMVLPMLGSVPKNRGAEMIDVSVLVDKLNGLGTGQDVRDFLVDQGIRGCPQESHNCPISNWIRRESGCAVSTETVVAVFETDPCKPVQQYSLEDGPKSFVSAFDAGIWPELITIGWNTEFNGWVEDDDYGLQDDYDNCDD